MSIFSISQSIAKQQCGTCKKWFEDRDFEAHLQGHLDEPVEEQASTQRPLLKCPLCDGTEFERKSGFVKNAFTVSGYNVVWAICRRCHFILQFYAGKTFFGFWGERRSNFSEIRDMLESGRRPEGNP